MENRHHCSESMALHLGFKISKLVLKVAMIGVGVCISKELHKIHKAIERKEK